jgi:hypothetical protein
MMRRYVKRRRLRGLELKRLYVVLTQDCYLDLLRMKGPHGTAAAIEMLIREKKARLERRHKKRL